MSRQQKGSRFERQICRELSKWWTDGERDDVFWRTSQSGGRATFRAQKGQRTYGHYGDIAAVDPIGEPLLRLFTIELKCGKSHGHPVELLECKGQGKFRKTLRQAIEAHVDACSSGWLLICRRDFGTTMAYVDWSIASVSSQLSTASPRAVYSGRIADKRIKFLALPFKVFLDKLKPQEIKETDWR